VSNAKLFVCPSSAKSINTGLKVPSLSYCSYAYAVGLNQQTYKDTVIMADGYWANNVTADAILVTTTALNAADNHGRDGINVVYVRGNAKWVASGNTFFLPQDQLKNCYASDATGLRNPSADTWTNVQ